MVFLELREFPDLVEFLVSLALPEFLDSQVLVGSAVFLGHLEFLVLVVPVEFQASAAPVFLDFQALVE